MDDSDQVVALWEAAQQHSDEGRFHEAIVSYEQAKKLLAEAASSSLPERLTNVISDLVLRVDAELKDHYELLEGNHFLALGLRRGAPKKGARTAYRAFVLRFHPDKNVSTCDTSALFRIGQEAYEVLSVPESCSIYNPKVLPDAWLRRRSDETRKLAAQEQRQRAVENAKKNMAGKKSGVAKKETAMNAQSQPQKPAPATAAKPSAQSAPPFRWLSGEELKMLPISLLVKAMTSAGLNTFLMRGTERCELEAAYLKAAHEEATQSFKSPSSKGAAGTPAASSAGAPVPVSRTSAFGGYVTKEAIRRHQERMFQNKSSVGVGNRSSASGGELSQAVGNDDGKAVEGEETEKVDALYRWGNLTGEEKKVSSTAPGELDPSWGRHRGFSDDNDTDEDDNRDGRDDGDYVPTETVRTSEPDIEPLWGKALSGLDDSEDEDDGDEAEDWDFAFDVSSLRWGRGSRMSTDGDFDDDDFGDFDDDDYDDTDSGSNARSNHETSAAVTAPINCSKNAKKKIRGIQLRESSASAEASGSCSSGEEVWPSSSSQGAESTAGNLGTLRARLSGRGRTADVAGDQHAAGGIFWGDSGGCGGGGDDEVRQEPCEAAGLSIDGGSGGVFWGRS